MSDRDGRGQDRSLGWIAVLAIGACALLVRFAVAHALAPTPLYLAPQLDAQENLTWAKRIAAGDWTIPPYPTKGLVYPVLLGLALRVGTGGLETARSLQILLGSACAAGIGLLAARAYGRSAGVAAGLGAALYAPFVFVDTIFWEDSLALAFLVAAAIALSGGARFLAIALAGACVGAAALVRPTTLVVALPAIVYLWRSADPTRRMRGLGVFAVALALVVGAGVAVVSRANGSFLFVRGYGSLNLWMGNTPTGGGVQSARLGGAWERLQAEPWREGAKSYADYESYFRAKLAREIAAHPSGFLRVLAAKVFWVTQAEEIRESQSLGFFRQESRLLGLLPGFGLVLAFAIPGILATSSKSPGLRGLLGGAAIALAAAEIATVVGFRYRLPVLVFLLPFAGAGAAGLARRLGERSWKKAAGMMAIGGAVLSFAHLGRHAASANFSEEVALTGVALEQLGRSSEAEATYRRAMALDPSSALGWDGVGRLALLAGKRDDAAADFEEALRRDPDFVRSSYHLGTIAEERGDVTRAVELYRRALAIDPRYVLALQRAAPLLLAAGHVTEAEALYRTLIALEPRFGPAWLALARIEGSRGDFTQGVADARRAIAEMPSAVAAWSVLGFLAIEARDLPAVDEASARLGALGEGDAAPSRLLAAAARRLHGDRETADTLLRELLRSQPGLGEARALFLRNAEERGRLAEAESFLAGLGTPSRAPR